MAELIKAYTNNNSAPDDGSEHITRTTTGTTKELLDTAIYDASGNQITSFGGGTEYTEDAAAAADPVGGAQILVRQDTPAGLTTTDGDNVARRGTDYGAAFSQILDSSGNFIDSFGGGTQYTEGDTDATITGTAAMMEVAADTLQPVQGTVAAGLLVNLGTNNDVTVAGVATAANQLADGHNVTIDNATVTTDSVTEYVDDGDWTALSSSHQLVGGIYQSTPGTITDGDTGPVRLDANGHIITSPHAESTALADDVSNTQSIWVDESSNLVPQPTFPFYYDGSTWDRVRGDSTNGMTVNLGSNNDVVTSPDNTIDSNNSTTTPLGGGAAFTGTGTDVSDYASVAITLFADVDGATDGMSFQFSTDNSNWDDTIAFTMDVSDSNTRRFQFPVTAQYFRLVYTNGGGGQSAFRVQTILNRTNILTSIHRVSDSLTTDRSAQLVRAVIAGETTAGGGSMVNVKVSPSGTLTVGAENDTASNFLAEVVGSTAHDAADSTDNPLGTGFQARTTNPTAVADGDRVRGIADDLGRQVVTLGQPRDLTVHQSTTITATSETTILTAGGAGVFHDLVSLVITNEDNQSVIVTIKDDTAGTTRLIVSLAPKGGAVLNFPYPVTQAVAADNWTATLDVNPDNNVNFFVQALVNV